MLSSQPNYLALSEFYDQCLEAHGPTPKGVDWPNAEDLMKRFDVMLEVFGKEPSDAALNLLDLGCGYGALVERLYDNNPKMNVSYTGMDVSSKMIAAAQQLFPKQTFITRDILKDPLASESFDYVVMNGLLTEKRDLPWEQMVKFAEQIINAAFKLCRKGIAFNVMSYHVDWCQPHLFYWSFDEVAAFLIKNCSRNFTFRQDYGLYEYTVYAYKRT